jgi:hypothetical protein
MVLRIVRNHRYSLDEQTITVREPDATTHLPPQYDELMSERSVLCLKKSALRLSGETNRARQRQNSAIIAAEVRRFAHVINTDGILGTPSGPQRQSDGARWWCPTMRGQKSRSSSWVSTRVFRRSLPGFLSRTAGQFVIRPASIAKVNTRLIRVATRLAAIGCLGVRILPGAPALRLTSTVLFCTPFCRICCHHVLELCNSALRQLACAGQVLVKNVLRPPKRMSRNRNDFWEAFFRTGRFP